MSLLHAMLLLLLLLLLMLMLLMLLMLLLSTISKQQVRWMKRIIGEHFGVCIIKTSNFPDACHVIYVPVPVNNTTNTATKQ
jgi:hypothetical protein